MRRKRELPHIEKPSHRARARTRLPLTADDVGTHGFTALDLPEVARRAPNVVPTEPLFVHVAYLLPLANCYPSLSQVHTRVALAFALMASAIYWAMRGKLRRSGLLRRLWAEQVLDVARSRVSAGVLISIADHFHILLAFVGLFLYAVNGIHYFGTSRTWSDSLYMGLMAFNLKGFDDFQITTVVAVRVICASLSVLNTLFVGFLAAAFLKPFVIVFGHK
jgi:hypothetical protein